MASNNFENQFSGSAAGFAELERELGKLTPMDSGMQSRVFATQDGSSVVKLYRNKNGDHIREANNMHTAGMSGWVIKTLDADNLDALVMKRFEGKPLEKNQLVSILPKLRKIITSLHKNTNGMVDVGKIHNKLKRFRSALSFCPLNDIFEAVEIPLGQGIFVNPASFCHLDLWQDNILVSTSGNEVVVIDWTKADWDDPLRDIALLKTGTLDLLSAEDSLKAALSFLPNKKTITLRRYRAYLALTTLHDLYWIVMNEPYEFERESTRKVNRTRHALARLPK